MQPPSNYLVPIVIEQTRRGERALRHLLPPPQGPHHLRRRADRRRRGQPGHRPAPLPRERGPGQGHPALHQLPGRVGLCRAWPCTTPCSTSSRMSAPSASGRPPAARGALLAGGQGQALRACPTPASSSTSPSSARARGQATDLEIEAREMLRIREILTSSWPQHTGQTLEKIDRDTDRDFIMNPPQSKEYGIIDEIIESLGGRRRSCRLSRPASRVTKDGGGGAPADLTLQQLTTAALSERTHEYGQVRRRAVTC